jgi:CspA family cold shock protein
MPEGRIRNYNDSRGYGFISEENGRKDVFFHVRTLADVFEPTLGMRVEFDDGTDRSGRPQAVNVRLLQASR